MDKVKEVYGYAVNFVSSRPELTVNAILVVIAAKIVLKVLL